MRPRLLVASGIAAVLLSARAHGQGPPESGTRAFDALASVLTSPRCVNCHVPGDAPLQGDDGHVHPMRVKRGADGRGTPAMQCRACHQVTNSVTPHAPPGVAGWRLPPPQTRMAWQGLSRAALCRTLNDPISTGGRSLQQLVEHVSHDGLVRWAWDPGPGRTRPPLSHEAFVAAFKTWVQEGAPCPAPEGALP